MKYLFGQEEKISLGYMKEAEKVAKKSTCKRSKCGCVIVKSSKIIGEGFNSPPEDRENQRRCSFDREKYDGKVTDKTCCIHAEQRAIMDALKNDSDSIKNSTLYFVRLDENDELARVEKPYCTICSKMALDVGIKDFVLFHKEGICVYDTGEYNTLSYNYKE
jgi:deoxycytidylate deaminase